MPLSIIVKGNPKYIDNNPMANKYYRKIAQYLQDRNIDVEFNDGADFTLPRLDADFYIGHSRGTSRKEFMPKAQQKNFLEFGTPSGIMHPADREWATKIWSKGTDAPPPVEHYEFSNEQKQAIDEILGRLKLNAMK